MPFNSNVTCGPSVELESLLSLAKMVAAGGSYTEHRKALPPPFPVPDWRWDQGKAGTCIIKVRMVWGRCWTKEVCQTSLQKEGSGWDVDPLKSHKSLGGWLVILEKHWSIPHQKLILTQGNKETSSLSCGLMLRTWTVHWLACHLHEPHGLNSHVAHELQEGVSLSLSPFLTWWSIAQYVHVLSPRSTWPCSLSSCMAHGLQEGAWNGQQPGTS